MKSISQKSSVIVKEQKEGSVRSRKMPCQEVNLCSKGKIQWLVDSCRLNVEEQEKEGGKKVKSKSIFFKYIRIKKLESKSDRYQGVEGTLRENKPTVET